MMHKKLNKFLEAKIKKLMNIFKKYNSFVKLMIVLNKMKKTKILFSKNQIKLSFKKIYQIQTGKIFKNY